MYEHNPFACETCDYDAHIEKGSCDCCNPKPEAPIISPWVRRNEDYAQYPQPRGSQYEGSDW